MMLREAPGHMGIEITSLGKFTGSMAVASGGGALVGSMRWVAENHELLAGGASIVGMIAGMCAIAGFVISLFKK